MEGIGEGLDEVVAAKYFTQLLDALESLHGNGFVHRDIRVDQLMVYGDENEQLLLGDVWQTQKLKDGVYAMAKKRPENDDFSTPVWNCPPEALHLHQFTPTSDIWMAGCALFEMYS